MGCAIDKLIRHNLWTNPDRWHWSDDDRFLRNGNVELVRPVVGNGRWAFIVEGIGQVPLSVGTHACIEMARLFKAPPHTEGDKP